MRMRSSRFLYRLIMAISILGTAGPFSYLIFHFIQMRQNDGDLEGINQPLPNKLYRELLRGPKKLILDWTGFFGKKLDNRYFNACPDLLKKCELVGDRRLVNRSEAVLFHLPNLSKRDIPAQRHFWQRYVYFIHESAANFGGYQWHNNLLFNWTMTMRYDSDIPWPYGGLVQRSRTHSSPEKPVDFESILQSKPKNVVWLVSHCNTPSKRELYVEQLKKYIEVDIYGRCGRLQCPKSQSAECSRKMNREYKFTLAFENSFCQDYVTEKVWHILNNSYLIPVLLKSSHVEHLLPYHSYISAEDFKDPKELATYLHRVASDPRLFESYFQWKETQEILTDDKRTDVGICRLCEKLIDETSPAKTYNDVHSWWVTGSKCDNDFVYKYVKRWFFF